MCLDDFIDKNTGEEQRSVYPVTDIADLLKYSGLGSWYWKGKEKEELRNE